MRLRTKSPRNMELAVCNGDCMQMEHTIIRQAFETELEVINAADPIQKSCVWIYVYYLVLLPACQLWSSHRIIKNIDTHSTIQEWLITTEAASSARWLLPADGCFLKNSRTLNVDHLQPSSPNNFGARWMLTKLAKQHSFSTTTKSLRTCEPTGDCLTCRYVCTYMHMYIWFKEDYFAGE